jgi:hypothetical protein
MGVLEYEQKATVRAEIPRTRADDPAIACTVMTTGQGS